MKKSIIFNMLIATGLMVGISATALAQRGHRGPQDVDGDGLISREEVLDHAEQKFNARDQDGDGVITLDEVLSSALERFDRRDLDQDGYISPNEGRQGRGRGGPQPTDEQ